LAFEMFLTNFETCFVSVQICTFEKWGLSMENESSWMKMFSPQTLDEFSVFIEVNYMENFKMNQK
jgi:hypothetical protein